MAAEFQPEGLSATMPAPAESRGVFITFEGGDGAGKSTHIRFLAKTLQERGYEVLSLREPGGTAIGERLRDLVLDKHNMEMAPRTELFIYEAARAQIVSQVIRPALERGAVVLCDRFYDSTVAYQGYGRGLDAAFIAAANAFACDGIAPDRTLLMVAPSAAEGLARAATVEPADRLEAAGVDFHSRVRRGFELLAEAEPERIATVVSQELPSQTARLIFAELQDLFPWMEECAADDAFFAALDEGFIHA